MENEDSSENNESTLEETQPTGKSEIDYPGKDATKVEKQSKVSSAENNKSRFKFIILWTLNLTELSLKFVMT